MTLPLEVVTMVGLGDTVYQRPWIRALTESDDRDVYVRTPWPQLVSDLRVIACTHQNDGLRTQAKNAARFTLDRGPVQAERIRPRYLLDADDATAFAEIGNAFRARKVGLEPSLPLDLPDFGPSPLRCSRPLALMPARTLRREWLHRSRGPLPEYLAEAALILKQSGYTVVVVGDVDGRGEWLDGALPFAHRYLVRGELKVEQLLAAASDADLVVGGVGWIVPVGLATRTPTIVIGGGCGGHNAPEKITDPRLDTSRMRFVLPDRYCRCRSKTHECDRTIHGFQGRFRETLTEIQAMRTAA